MLDGVGYNMAVDDKPYRAKSHLKFPDRGLKTGKFSK